MLLPLLFAASLFAQQFSPKMPEGVPAVEGAVSEVFALRYIDVVQGTGAPATAGQRYTVHYTGWLRDGKKFDSSRDRKDPFQFVQGRRQVIAGWEAGFEGMKVGGKRRLFLPYQLAYGEKGNATIPAKAELIFDVELLNVEEVPEQVPSAELLDPLKDAEEKIIGLAKTVPEDKYDWTPAPGVRSFREVFLHIAYGNKLMTDLGQKAPERDALNARVEKQWKDEKEKLPKARILELLTESFEYIRKNVQPLRAGALGSDITFFGRATTRRGVYIELDNHVSEHLGQLIAYARMTGIVPPWSTK
jgi:uncharacterized damage-inducible protein DinB